MPTYWDADDVQKVINLLSSSQVNIDETVERNRKHEEGSKKTQIGTDPFQNGKLKKAEECALKSFYEDVKEMEASSAELINVYTSMREADSISEIAEKTGKPDTKIAEYSLDYFDQKMGLVEVEYGDVELTHRGKTVLNAIESLEGYLDRK